jgi:PTS system mannose-specific IIC component
VLELLAMGVGSFGGASIPDYYLGAIMGTTVAVMSGKGSDYGVLIGLPLAVLAIQLDVLVRTATVFFVHRAKAAADRGDVRGAYRWLWNGYWFWIAKYVIPVTALFLIGADRLTRFVEAMPRWLVEGFSVAGGLLPAVGIAVLLRFMNTKAHLPFLIVGFGLASFLHVPMIGVALFGVAAAILVFRSAVRRDVPAGAGVALDRPSPPAGGSDDEL